MNLDNVRWPLCRMTRAIPESGKTLAIISATINQFWSGRSKNKSFTICRCLERWLLLQGYKQGPQQCASISSTYWALDNMQLSRTFQMNFHFAEFMQVRSIINLTAVVIRLWESRPGPETRRFISRDIGDVQATVPFILNPQLSLLDKLNKIQLKWLGNDLVIVELYVR